MHNGLGVRMTYATEAPNAHIGYLTYKERTFTAYLRRLECAKHPRLTKQGFDFNMNLGVYQ